jgi:hypothetical protein
LYFVPNCEEEYGDGRSLYDYVLVLCLALVCCSISNLKCSGDDNTCLQVGWGEATMIEAERLLLLAALQDPLNLRFLLLSDRYYIYMLT